MVTETAADGNEKASAIMAYGLRKHVFSAKSGLKILPTISISSVISKLFLTQMIQLLFLRNKSRIQLLEEMLDEEKKIIVQYFNENKLKKNYE